MSDLEETIRQNAQNPARATSDTVTVEQHKLTEQIEADRYLRSTEAVVQTRRGLRFNKFVPPGV